MSTTRQWHTQPVLPAPTGDGPTEGRPDRCQSLADLLGRFEVLDWDERGTSTVIVLGDGPDTAEPSIVAKVSPHSREDPRVLFELHTAVGPEVAATPVAWGEDPRFFAYEYLPGRTLKQRIDELVGSDMAELLPIVHRLGALLARFHRRAPDTPRTERVEQRLYARCRRLAGAREDRSDRVRSLCDSGPHNVIVGPDDEVRLIDLPGVIRWVDPEFDVGALAHRIARRAASAGQAEARQPIDVGEIIDAVCRGYEATDPRRLDRRGVAAAFATSSIVYARRSLAPTHDHFAPGRGLRELRWALGVLQSSRRDTAPRGGADLTSPVQAESLRIGERQS